MLDTRYRVEIPGGINLDAEVVGPIPRFLAFAIDLCIRGVIVFVLLMVAIPFGSFGVGGGFFLIFLFAIEWLYPVLFEVFWRGQTPGKKALGISVINDDLTPVSLGTSLVRNLLRTVDFLPLFYLAGLVTMLSNRHFQWRSGRRYPGYQRAPVGPRHPGKGTRTASAVDLAAAHGADLDHRFPAAKPPALRATPAGTGRYSRGCDSPEGR